MNKDTKEVLTRLEADLLDQEDLPQINDQELETLLEEFLEEDQSPAPVKAYRAYNSDQTDEDLDIYSDQVYNEPEQSHTGLNLLALGAIAVSAAAVVYMLLRFR